MSWDWSFLLHQETVWVDSSENVRKISEMDTSHAENVYRFLLSPRRAEGILRMISASAFAAQGPTEGTAASDAYERELDRLLEAQNNPVQWMKELPLVKALYARVWGPGPEPVEEPAEDVQLVLLKVKTPPRHRHFRPDRSPGAGTRPTALRRRDRQHRRLTPAPGSQTGKEVKGCVRLVRRGLLWSHGHPASEHPGEPGER